MTHTLPETAASRRAWIAGAVALAISVALLLVWLLTTFDFGGGTLL